MISRWSFAFTKKSFGDVLKRLEGILRTSPGRRLGNVFKKGCHDFQFRPIYQFFGTKIKTSLRRLCNVYMSVGMDSDTISVSILRL